MYIYSWGNCDQAVTRLNIHLWWVNFLLQSLMGDLPAWWPACMVFTVAYVWCSSHKSILNPFTPESDQCQNSPAASKEIWHHTVWRTWLFIAYSDEKWLYYKFSLHHSYNRFLKGWENTLFELRSERVKVTYLHFPSWCLELFIGCQLATLNNVSTVLYTFCGKHIMWLCNCLSFQWVMASEALKQSEEGQIEKVGTPLFSTVATHKV